MRCFCIPRSTPKTRTGQHTPQPGSRLVSDARQQSSTQPDASGRRVRRVDTSQLAPPLGVRSCTGLLGQTFLARLETHAKRFEPMAIELSELRAATDQMRAAEKALANLPAARQALRTQVQRVQMVLQGHRHDIGSYTPNPLQVTHLSTCQADWKRLQRVLDSIDAISQENTSIEAPAPPTRAHETAARWRDLCTHREQLTHALRKVHAHADQAEWPTASQQLRQARHELAALLAEAQRLAQSGDALLLDPDEHTGLTAMLRETPQRQATLDRFQTYIDQRRRARQMSPVGPNPDLAAMPT